METQITLKRQELNEVKASSLEIFCFGSLRSGGYMMKRLHDNPQLPFHSQRCHSCELCSLMMPIRPNKRFAVDAAEQLNHFASPRFKKKKKVLQNKM